MSLNNNTNMHPFLVGGPDQSGGQAIPLDQERRAMDDAMAYNISGIQDDGGYGYGLFGDNTTFESSGFETARTVFKTMQPIICVFGLLGNVLTLYILTRKRLKLSCDGAERTVHIGLTALAVSDLLFCLSLLPYGILTRYKSYTSQSLRLIYFTHAGAIINTFILTSTWLTVTMATSRYLAICHPFRARHLIGMRGTKTSISLVFLISTVFNIPRFFRYRHGNWFLTDGTQIYFQIDGYLAPNTEAYTVYIWIYFSIGIFLPLAALSFCNICLVKALRESVKVRRRYRVPAAHVDSNFRITSILVTIVVMYITLVSPAEILLFLEDLLPRDTRLAMAYLIAREFTNVLQTVNFSSNFVLFFVLNVHFRRALRDLVLTCCAVCVRKKGSPKGALQLNRQTSLRTTQTAI